MLLPKQTAIVGCHTSAVCIARSLVAVQVGVSTVRTAAERGAKLVDQMENVARSIGDAETRDNLMSTLLSSASRLDVVVLQVGTLANLMDRMSRIPFLQWDNQTTATVESCGCLELGEAAIDSGGREIALYAEILEAASRSLDDVLVDVARVVGDIEIELAVS